MYSLILLTFLLYNRGERTSKTAHCGRFDGLVCADLVAATDGFAIDVLEEEADVVAGGGVIVGFAEALDADDNGLHGAVGGFDGDRLVNDESARFDAAGCDDAATGDREDVVDDEKPWFVGAWSWLCWSLLDWRLNDVVIVAKNVFKKI